MPKRFDNEIVHKPSVQDAIHDYRVGSEYRNYDREKADFYKRHESHEIFYDPYTKQVVKRGVPLKTVSPEFEVALALVAPGVYAASKTAKVGQKAAQAAVGKTVLRGGSRVAAKDASENTVKAFYKKMVDRLGLSDDAVHGASNVTKNKSITSRTINTEEDMQDAIESYRRHIQSEETQMRLADIDNELGTNYQEILNDAVDPNQISYFKNKNYLNDSANPNENMIKLHQEAASNVNSGGYTYYREPFANHGQAFGIDVVVNKGHGYGVYPHEMNHFANAMQSFKFNRKFNPGRFQNQRTIRFISDDKGRSILYNKQTFLDNLKKFNPEKYDENVEKVFSRLYDYFSDPDELTSQLSTLVHRNKLRGLPAYEPYRSYDDVLEGVTKKTALPGQSFTPNLRAFMRHAVSDKQAMLNNINKYLFTGTGVGAAGVGYGLNGIEKDK